MRYEAPRRIRALYHTMHISGERMRYSSVGHQQRSPHEPAGAVHDLHLLLCLPAAVNPQALALALAYTVPGRLRRGRMELTLAARFI